MNMFVQNNGTKFLNDIIARNNETGTILNKQRTDCEAEVLQHDDGSSKLNLIRTDILGKLNCVQKFQLADKLQLVPD